MAFRRNLPFVIVFFFLGKLVSAQDGFFIDISGIQPRFFQRLVWSADEYALFFEVVIERETGRTFVEFHREITEENMLNVSLPPGKYRYGVIAHDLLGLAGDMSEWRELEIIPAFQPFIESYDPDTFYMDDRLQRVLEISGGNILDESEIYLRGEDNSLFPIERNILGTGQATLYFDDETLIPGIYDIFIKNPGGLEAVAVGFVVAYKKPSDVFFKISWTPLIPIYGEFKNHLGSSFHFAGGSIGFDFVSSRRGAINGGVELSFGAYALNLALNTGENNSSQSLFNIGSDISIMEFNFNFLIQTRFLRRQMAVTFRFGFGLFSLNRHGAYAEIYAAENAYPAEDVFNAGDEYPRSAPTNETNVHWNLGLSYMLYLQRIMYMEVGADFVIHQVSVPSGSIKPRLAIGWQF